MESKLITTRTIFFKISYPPKTGPSLWWVMPSKIMGVVEFLTIWKLPQELIMLIYFHVHMRIYQ
jgi:hypothetical protein